MALAFVTSPLPYLGRRFRSSGGIMPGNEPIFLYADQIFLYYRCKETLCHTPSRYLEPKTAPAPHLGHSFARQDSRETPEFSPAGPMTMVPYCQGIPSVPVLYPSQRCLASFTWTFPSRISNIGRSLRLPSQNNSIIPGLLSIIPKFLAVGDAMPRAHHIHERHIEPAGRRRSRFHSPVLY